MQAEESGNGSRRTAPRARRSDRHARSASRSRGTAPAARARVPRRSSAPAAPADSVRARRPSGRRVRDRRPGVGLKVVGAIALLLVVLSVVGVTAGWYLLYRPDSTSAAGAGVPVHLTIAQGATTADIAGQLSDVGVIDNVLAFRFAVRQADADGLLRAGEYDLTTGMPDDEVIDRLLTGPVLTYFEVPIPEGFTARQIAERFAARAGIPGDELATLVTTGADQFVAEHPYLSRAHNGSLEGFLFPATYTVEEGTSAHDVVEMMLDQFDAQLAEVDLSYATSRGLDVYDVATIASILERESKLPGEFPLVSSVIYNRLAKPMRLQLCATVLYEMPAGTDKLTEADLQRESAYNTYLHDGLPVGPISNPGRAALDAAAQPADTNYYYYVLTGKDGSQTFTSTYSEFLRAKDTYHEVYGN